MVDLRRHLKSPREYITAICMDALRTTLALVLPVRNWKLLLLTTKAQDLYSQRWSVQKSQVSSCGTKHLFKWQ